MLTRFTLVILLSLLAGCSTEVGEHFRDISDYDTVRSRLPSSGVKHFPVNVPADAKMHGYFVPMQGSDGLQLAVRYEKSEFARLLAEAENQNFKRATGVDFEDPQTVLSGQTKPQIVLGDEPEIPNPKDHIFTIQDGPQIDCGMIFRTDKNIVIYWVFHDG